MLKIRMGLERKGGRFLLTANADRFTLEPEDLLRWAETLEALALLELEGDHDERLVVMARELRAAFESKAPHMIRLDVAEATIDQEVTGDRGLVAALRKRILRIVPEVVVRSLWGDVDRLMEAVRR